MVLRGLGRGWRSIGSGPRLARRRRPSAGRRTPDAGRPGVSNGPLLPSFTYFLSLSLSFCRAFRGQLSRGVLPLCCERKVGLSLGTRPFLFGLTSSLSLSLSLSLSFSLSLSLSFSDWLAGADKQTAADSAEITKRMILFSFPLSLSLSIFLSFFLSFFLSGSLLRSCDKHERNTLDSLLSAVLQRILSTGAIPYVITIWNVFLPSFT